MFNVNGGKLTLKGGTASNRGQVALVSNGGEVVIENGTYTSSKAAAFRAGVDGTVTVNGGTLTGQEGAVDSRGSGTNGCNAKITINGGHLTGLDNFAVSTNGSSGMGHNVITINGGTLEGNIKTAGYEAIGVYVANDDVLVMNGGEIIAHGGTGICMRGGEVTINNGTVTATNVDKNGETVADGRVGDGATVLTGCSAIVYEKLAGYSGNTKPMKLTITGGTITGVDKSIDVISDEENPQIIVTGGTLTPPYPSEPAA